MSGEKNLNNPCNEPKPFQDSLNIDEVPPDCEVDFDIPNQKKVSQKPDLGWFDAFTLKKTGIGTNDLCDPMIKGHIINKDTDRNVIYRYNKALRGTDEGVMDMFKDIVVIDEQDKAWPVPIVWATQEKAVAIVVQDNVRKDNGIVTDRIRLPIMSIHRTGLNPNLKSKYAYHKAVDYMRDFREDGKPGFTINEKRERDTVFGVATGIPLDLSYTLYVWTLYVEDMNQIVEQIIPKIVPMGYIRVRGVQWEIGVKYESYTDNTDTEPGAEKLRVVKCQFNLTAETCLPQPLVRKKAVLKTNIQFVEGLRDDDIKEVLFELESAVKELGC